MWTAASACNIFQRIIKTHPPVCPEDAFFAAKNYALCQFLVSHFVETVVKQPFFLA
jgi:hypothetical protein